MSVISAKEFRERATRVIEIEGFEPGEKIQVRIRPASILNMLITGKLPNSLLSVVQELFNVADIQNLDENAAKELTKDAETLKQIMKMMDDVCRQCLVEPTYDEIGDLLTDGQKGQIMAEAQGNVTAATPSIQK